MEPSISLFSVIMLLGAAHGLFLALALINTNSGHSTAHRFLALFTLVFAVDLGHEFLYQTNYLLKVLELGYIDPNINLLYGPSLYLYIRALTTGGEFQLKRIQWLHFCPFVVAMVLCALLPELSAEQFINLFYDDAPTDNRQELVVLKTISAVALSSAILIGLYLILSIRRLILHAKMIRQHFSSIERISLNWLRNLLLAFLLLYLIFLFDGFLSQSLGFDQEINNLLYLMVVVMIYTMSYLGLRQPAIFSHPTTASETASSAQALRAKDKEEAGCHSEPKTKYQTSALDAEMSGTLREELQRHMETEKPHLDSKLTLTQLATQIGISTNYLSQVINEQFRKNFFDFINGYRVDEAKRLLADPEQADTGILNIALDAGFNSKSAFYVAFKKHTDMTPSQYRISLRAADDTPLN